MAVTKENLGFLKTDLDEDLSTLFERFPAREAVLSFLSSHFGQACDPASPLYVYGHTGTGKTTVVRELLSFLDVPFAFVNCVECFTQRLLFERIVNMLVGHNPSSSNGFSSYRRCDKLSDLVEVLGDVCSPTQTTYLVFDKAERLRDFDATLMPAILRLDELVQRNICPILISEIVFDKVRCGTGVREPCPVLFPAYTKPELLTILERDCPDGFEPSFFRGFVGLLHDVLHTSCRELGELRHLAILLFPKYAEPVTAGDVEAKDKAKLYANIAPYLKSSLERVYLREVTTSQLLTTSTPGKSLAFELPLYAKYLVIASYLASYNPAKYDLRFFTAKSTKRQLGKEKVAPQLRGPKAFTSERMFAIFQSILDEPIPITAEIHHQLSSLVTLNLLQRVSSPANLEAPAYKCNITYDFVRDVARDISFALGMYLYVPS